MNSSRRSRATAAPARISFMPMWTATSAIRRRASCRSGATYAGDVPVDGASGNFEWDGYIPFDELPQAYNPPWGVVVTANQNPFPPDYPYRVSRRFAAPYRSRQILDMLRASGNRLKPEDGLRIQKDVYSGFNKFLARQLAAAYADRKGTSKVFDSAIAMLRDVGRADGFRTPRASGHYADLSISAQGDCRARVAGQRRDLRVTDRAPRW